MKRRIIAASLAVIIAAGFYACGQKPNEKGTPTDAEASSSASAETTAAATTTAPVTTTEATTAETTTTKPLTTKIITTTKKVATTVKKVITTKPTTEMTTEKRTRVNSLLEKRTEEEELVTELRYGVVHRKVVTTYYEEREDGTEVVVKEEITADIVDRTLYYADYDDLLPAAKENRETYRKEINEVLKIINGYRAEGGLEPLKLNEELTVIACVRAEEIAWSGNHNHTRPNLKSCFSLMRENGFGSGLAGENIGWGFAEPETVCQAWKDSKTHYENIMNPEFTEIGIGVAKDPKEGANLCWAQYFYGK
ncbi:MAG: hypothetical protein IJE72_02370 [Clostridia bacterium]|nr:hypothetical protein [Clostridia bacterium]